MAILLRGARICGGDFVYWRRSRKHRLYVLNTSNSVLLPTDRLVVPAAPRYSQIELILIRAANQVTSFRSTHSTVSSRFTVTPPKSSTHVSSNRTHTRECQLVSPLNTATANPRASFGIAQQIWRSISASSTVIFITQFKQTDDYQNRHIHTRAQRVLKLQSSYIAMRLRYSAMPSM